MSLAGALRAGRVAQPAARLAWALAAAAGLGGLAAYLAGAGLVALWCFVVLAVVLAFVLELPYALVSPLFAGLLGWLVDMLPFVILCGWAAVCARWALGLLADRRPPRGGRWIWLPVFLVAWTAAGVVVVSSLDFKHFLLLVALQGLASATLLAVADQLADLERRAELIGALCLYVIVLGAGVGLQWAGVPLEDIQDTETSARAEAAYGVDAFPNSTGMIKWARAKESGAGELRRELKALAREHSGIPPFDVFRPKFRGFDSTVLLVRFKGSARPFEDLLARHEVELVWDNVGTAPAETVPRLRSFPRNALTYAGVCAALAPFALFLSWSTDRRRRLLGRAGVVACLFGAGMSLARGAWIAMLLGALYLLVDGGLQRRRAASYLVALVSAAVVLTAFFLVRYQSDPLTARAGGEASIATRSSLYQDTIATVSSPLHILLGFGTEQPRDEEGSTINTGAYVPRAGTHSTYLNYLFRTGVPGALGLAALYVIAWLMARAAARSRSDRERDFAALAATGVVTIAAHAVILNLFVEPVYTLVVMLLVGSAVAAGLGSHRPLLPWKASA